MLISREGIGMKKWDGGGVGGRGSGGKQGSWGSRRSININAFLNNI